MLLHVEIMVLMMRNFDLKPLTNPCHSEKENQIWLDNKFLSISF